MKHGDGGGGDPRGGAAQDPEVTLDVQEEEAEVLEHGRREAHDEEGGRDHHPAVPPVRRPGPPAPHPPGRVRGPLSRLSWTVVRQ